MSVNSFGFGGCNSHAILDDALHYLQERGIEANHFTVAHPNAKKTVTLDSESQSSEAKVLTNGNGVHLNGHANGVTNGHANGNGTTNGHHTPPSSSSSSSKILLFSASDEKALKRTTDQYQAYYTTNAIASTPSKVDILAYTLAARRSHLLYRTFAVVDDSTSSSSFSTAKPVKTSSEAGVALVFTGQGAQYVHMGAGLLQYPVFEETLRRVDEVYKSLGCQWSVFGKLSFSFPSFVLVSLSRKT